MKHQISKHFQPDADKNFKDEEFEKALANYIVGFIQCYPSLIEKKIENNIEVWVFKFKV